MVTVSNGVILGQTVNLSDYVKFSDVIDSVQQGNLAPITSNAVYNALTNVSNLRCVIGGYTGTGTFGSSNKNNFYCGFHPKVFMIYQVLNGYLFIFDCYRMKETDSENMYARVESGSYNCHARFVTEGSNIGVRWWANSPEWQANELNYDYYCFALG